MKRLNPDMISHSLFLHGMGAYRTTILEIVEQINDLQESVEELQGLVSGEMMGYLVQPSELREVVAELGHGWKIERQPQSIPAATTVEDVERQMANVNRLVGALHRHFVLSPGYPQDGDE